MIAFIGKPEPGSHRPFSRATRAGNLVFVSGHSAPHDPDHGIERPPGARDQVRAALAVMAQVLIEAGSSMDRVVQVSMLIRDPVDYVACNEEYVKHFPPACQPATPPASASPPTPRSPSPASRSPATNPTIPAPSLSSFNATPDTPPARIRTSNEKIRYAAAAYPNPSA